jgi:hypothetical protein
MTQWKIWLPWTDAAEALPSPWETYIHLFPRSKLNYASHVSSKNSRPSKTLNGSSKQWLGYTVSDTDAKYQVFGMQQISSVTLQQSQTAHSVGLTYT